MELKEAPVSKHPDSMMTPAQIARRKFKSSLPRKLDNRRLSAMEALGATFSLFDRFRAMVAAEGVDPNTTQAGLVYVLPESNPAVFAATITLIDPSGPEIAAFSMRVTALDRPLFLGVLFMQEDPDPDVNPDYKRVAFCAQFMGGPEAEGRLLAARKRQQLGTN
ncbi:MAG: hypothetical protein WCF17_01970 [Terracidiphilus sp.]